LGTKIKALREHSGMSREEFALKAGLSPETLTRVEQDEEIPPVGTILQISSALGLDAGGLLNQAETETRKQSKQQGLEKRRRSYAYETLAPGSPHMHMKAFAVTIDPHRDHEMVEYRHEGEEFIYVLRGELDVTVGENQHHLDQGKSLHFHATIPHMLSNPGPVKTELIVVLYTP
jgi:transcriptional regulator with XRE-family HTH domain